MTHAGYLAAGYGVSIAVLAAYAWWVVARRRSLSRLLGEPASLATPRRESVGDVAGGGLVGERGEEPGS